MKAKARFARIYQLFGLAALTLGLLAGAAPASASPGSGWLRLAHLSPNTPAVDVYLYSFHNSNALIVTRRFRQASTRSPCARRERTPQRRRSFPRR